MRKLGKGKGEMRKLQKGSAHKAATDLCVPGQGDATSSQVCLLAGLVATPEISSLLQATLPCLSQSKIKY